MEKKVYEEDFFYIKSQEMTIEEQCLKELFSFGEKNWSDDKLDNLTVTDIPDKLFSLFEQKIANFLDYMYNCMNALYIITPEYGDFLYQIFLYHILKSHNFPFNDVNCTKEDVQKQIFQKINQFSLAKQQVVRHYLTTKQLGDITPSTNQETICYYLASNIIDNDVYASQAALITRWAFEKFQKEHPVTLTEEVKEELDSLSEDLINVIHRMDGIYGQKYPKRFNLFCCYMNLLQQTDFKRHDFLHSYVYEHSIQELLSYYPKWFKLMFYLKPEIISARNLIYDSLVKNFV